MRKSWLSSPGRTHGEEGGLQLCDPDRPTEPSGWLRRAAWRWPDPDVASRERRGLPATGELGPSAGRHRIVLNRWRRQLGVQAGAGTASWTGGRNRFLSRSAGAFTYRYDNHATAKIVSYFRHRPRGDRSRPGAIPGF
jgi:hypothetical protein